MKPIYAVLILIALFAVVAAASWQTWANPVIDGGREMNTPLRLLRGESLYSQVYYLYGPAAPFFNALLYRLFGIHLNTLYAAGLWGSLLLVLMAFYLGRMFMPTYEALLAATSVLVLCIFKHSGNLIFPYTFAVLYGTLLGTFALIAQVGYLKSYRAISLLGAGAASGLAVCCKLEFGFAAIASLLVLLMTESPGQRARIARLALAPALAVPALIYGFVLAGIPAESMFKDTFILPGTIPAELMYWNKMKLGLNDIGRTLRELISALALLGGAAAAISLAAARMAGEPIVSAGLSRNVRRLWWLMSACWGLILVHVLLFGTNWDMNPFRALPVLCLVMIYYCVKWPDRICAADASRRTLLLVTAFSLAVMARVAIRVPGGGAYGAGLLPVPLVLFLYMTTARFRFFIPSEAARDHRRRAVLLLLTVALFAGAGVLAFRQVRSSTTWLRTPRGNLGLPAPITSAMEQALEFLAQNTNPGEYVLALPEGSSLNFLADRQAPLRYEIVTPGFLTNEGEQSAIRRIQEKGVRYIFLMNRPTSEFGPKAFGRDYCRTLMGWIEANYTPAAVFGEHVSLDSQIGDASFFLKCYRKR